jgi:Fe2+ transport system protein FeoA
VKALSLEARGNCIHLLDLEPGSRARLCVEHEDRRAAGRLAELGFVPGTEVRIVRVAPLRDPVEVEIRGTRFCARRSELQGLCVVPVIDG